MSNTWDSVWSSHPRPQHNMVHPLKTNFLFLLVSVQRFISEDKLPHLLFYGPPGTGKTSTILACARQLYKDKEFNSMVLEVPCNPPLRVFVSFSRPRAF